VTLPAGPGGMPLSWNPAPGPVAEPAAPSELATGVAVCKLLALPREVFVDSLPKLLSGAASLASLASTSQQLVEELRDSEGRLRVGSLAVCRASAVEEGLAKIKIGALEELRVDLTCPGSQTLTRLEIERAVRHVADALPHARSLTVLALKLPSFDSSLDRLRLSSDVWEALTRGLASLAQYGRLRTLELSTVAIKESQATRAVKVPEGCCRRLRRAASSPEEGSGATAAASTAAGGVESSLTFLQALGSLDSLEELSLVQNELFTSTAQLFPPVLMGLARLKRVDLTRNYLSKQAMQALRDALPKGVELRGEGQQTFFFY